MREEEASSIFFQKNFLIDFSLIQNNYRNEKRKKDERKRRRKKRKKKSVLKRKVNT